MVEKSGVFSGLIGKRIENGLQAIANKTNYMLTDFDIALFDRELRQYPQEAIIFALEDIYKNLSSRDPFPSIAAIERKLNVEVDEKSLAVNVAADIIRCVRKHGWPWVMSGYSENAIKEIGGVGVRVVEMFGGWKAICEMANEMDIAHFNAQIRDAARSVLLQKVVEKQQAAALPEKTRQVIQDALPKL